MEYSIVVPAYNEAERITSSLTQILVFMRNFSSDFEVIVVDDGSVDKTVEVVEEYIKVNPEVKLIKSDHRGKGYSVRVGVSATMGKYVYMADADMATPIEELKRLMVWIIDNDFDIAIASREGKGAVRRGEPFYRHLMGKVFNFIIQLLILPGIQDTQCGFKAMKGDVARRIFNKLILFGDTAPKIKVPRVTAFDVELLVIAKRNGYKIRAVPVTWSYVPTVRVSPVRDSISNLMDVLKIKSNDLRHLYQIT